MKDYYVLWTYIANYSKLMKVPARSAAEAKQEVCGFFGPKFTEKATVYVFDSPPSLLMYKGEVLNFETYRYRAREEA